MTHAIEPLPQAPPAVGLAGVRRWPSRTAREWVERLAASWCDVPGVLALVAYGSAVRDVPGSADVDLLFVYDGAPPALPAAPLDVDLRGYDKAEVEPRIAVGHDVLGWALRFGVVICERDRFWSALAERWRSNVPLPSPESADIRAAKAARYYEELRAIGDDGATHEQYLAMLTQRARGRLIRAGVHPASRPELPSQLIQIGEAALAEDLSRRMTQRH